MRYFKLSEFKCLCMREVCDAVPVELSLIGKLSELRQAWGKPLRVTSGCRCPYWNAKVGGKPESQHLLGMAADLWIGNPVGVGRLAEMADALGFGGIGTAKTWLHVDLGPSGRRWTYP